MLLRRTSIPLSLNHSFSIYQKSDFNLSKSHLNSNLFALCILCGVRSACGGEIGEKGSAKGKEIREDRVEEAKGIENRAVVDGVFRTSR